MMHNLDLRKPKTNEMQRRKIKQNFINRNLEDYNDISPGPIKMLVNPTDSKS